MVLLMQTQIERETVMSKSGNNKILVLSRVAYENIENARRARWNLGRELLATYYTEQSKGVWVTNYSLDKDAPTVTDAAKANYKALGKSLAAVKVFYSEAIKFAKAHKSADAAANETIKKKAPAKPKRFNKNREAVLLIEKHGDDRALEIADAIRARVGK